MNLREMMAVDAAVLLNREDLGEQALYQVDGETQQKKFDVRFIAQPERQTIRRAFIWTAVTKLTPSTGDLFTISRGADVMTYRVMYSDTAETGIQRHICHEQLQDTVLVVDRDRYKTERGADAWTNATPQSYRAKIVHESSEPRTTNNVRRMRGEYRIYFETLPQVTTDQIIVDGNGKAFKINQVDKPIERIDLPYMTCSRLDA